MSSWRGALALLLLSLVLTNVLQSYVGKAVLYTPQHRAERLALHYAIVNDREPPGGWEAIGAGGTNHRVLVPFFVHALERVFGLHPLQGYRLVDTAALFLLFPTLFVFLRRWLEPPWCLVGVLYLAAVLPTTYHHFYFHPWDRPSALVWLLSLGLIRDRRPLALGITLAIGTLVKFDLLFLPLLYVATVWPEQSGRKTALQTAGLSLATVGVFLVVSALRPQAGTRYEAEFFEKLRTNLIELGRYNLRHATLLLLALPALGAAAFRPTRCELPEHERRFLRWLAPFALLHLPIYLALTHLREARALVPFALLLLPPALLALRAWLVTASDAANTPGVPDDEASPRGDPCDDSPSS